MNKRLYELKKETNYCAGVGEIACLLEHIGEAIVLVNGPRFCYLQMKRILQQMLPFSIEDRLYCSDVDENAIVFGTEGKVKKVLRQQSAKTILEVAYKAHETGDILEVVEEIKAELVEDE